MTCYLFFKMSSNRLVLERGIYVLCNLDIAIEFQQTMSKAHYSHQLQLDTTGTRFGLDGEQVLHPHEI